MAIVLTHATSAINPLIYAYTMPGFAAAFRKVLTCDAACAPLTQPVNPRSPLSVNLPIKRILWLPGPLARP